MNSYYLNSSSGIPSALRERALRRATVRKHVDQFVAETYGIEGFTQLVHSHLPASIQAAIAEGKSVGVLARQVPGICGEDVAMYLLCESLGMTPFAWSFVRDTFVGVNHDKRNRARIPWLSWSKKGNPVVRNDTVVEGGLGFAEGRTLESLRTASGASLPEYHGELRAKVFGDRYPLGDVSRLHGELLARATRSKPVETYRVIGGKDVRTRQAFTADEARALTVRPTSDWYYVLYLSMFVDGSLVLLDTYENPNGGVPEAKKLFEQTMDRCVGGYGYAPMVIQTAPLCQDMMYCNKALIDQPGAVDRLLGRSLLWHSNTVDASRHFADQAVLFGRESAMALASAAA